MKSSVLDNYEDIRTRHEELHPTSPIAKGKLAGFSIQSRDDIVIIKDAKRLTLTRVQLKKMVFRDFATGKWYCTSDPMDDYLYEIEPPKMA